MGIWRGTAPLSNGGDWSHGAVLNLKFNSHSLSSAEVSEADTKSIGDAYSLALQMVFLANDQFQRDRMKPDSHVVTVANRYFNKTGFDRYVKSVLNDTYTGLRNAVNKDGRSTIYLFTKTSKKGNATDAGYIKNWPGRLDDKKHLPQGQRYMRQDTDKTMDDINKPKVDAGKGHIHLNLSEIRKAKDGQQLIITIIHEATHRYAGTGDFAYYPVDQKRSAAIKFNSMTDAERMNNADSYAYFCHDLFYDK
jgi:hypothetical protein